MYCNAVKAGVNGYLALLKVCLKLLLVLERTRPGFKRHFLLNNFTEQCLEVRKGLKKCRII